jgi:hypothetical protein
MIKKLSYRNAPVQTVQKKINKIPSVGMSENSNEGAGRNSFKLPGESYPIQDNSSPDGLIDSDLTASDAINTIRNLADVADDLDKNGLESEADFVDFLIKKFAQVTNMPVYEEERYIEYVYKLYNSDIKNYIDKISNLSEAFSSECANSISKGIDKESSKKDAFQKIMLMRIKND